MKNKSNYESVLNAFQDYLQTNNEIEIFWSEKKNCYLFMKWYEDEAVEIIESAEELCVHLLDELYMDVYLEHNLHQKHTGVDWSLTDEAKEDFLKRVQLYMNKLPEYQYLVAQALEK